MASQQPTIREFLAKPRQARPHSNVASVILIDDSSEESDDEQEPDAVASQEEATCSAISVDVVDCTSSDRSDDRREESEDSEGSSADLELSVAQVSYISDLEEGSIVNNARAKSDLVIEDHGVPVNTCIDRVPECSSTLVPQPCTCVGCTDYNKSNQPLEVAQSKLIQSHASKERQPGKKKQYSRTIQTAWYKRYPWITVCTIQYKIYCRVCCLAKQHGLLSTSGKNSSFIAEGFGNWNKALERFEMHEKSEMHREALERLEYRASNVHIGNLLNREVAADQEFHRCMLLKLLRAIRFLAKQGLAFRGHNESSEAFQGNLYQHSGNYSVIMETIFFGIILCLLKKYPKKLQ